MDQQREDEILLNVALGLDPLTAVVAAADDRPPKGPKTAPSANFGYWILLAVALVLLWLLR
jgi:hypothetical protein